MELDYLLFLRSIRSGNFELHKFSIRRLLPWMFTLDRYNYARWLSIHLCDMENLHKTDPCVYDEFSKYGNFVISRTKNPFSAMGIDHRHEQLNKDVKGNGGMIGLTEDPEKFRCWSVCSPETARVVKEFEKVSVLNQVHDTGHEFHHHEHSDSFQKRFAGHVKDLSSEFIRPVWKPVYCSR